MTALSNPMGPVAHEAQPLVTCPMNDLYLPRPERWPQFSLRGMLVVMTLVALGMPSTIAAYRRWHARPTVPASRMLMINIPLIIEDEEEDRLGRFPLPN